jgi:hypothetical protein
MSPSGAKVKVSTSVAIFFLVERIAVVAGAEFGAACSRTPTYMT